VASFVKIAHAVFLGETPRGLVGISEVGPSMRFGPAVLATLCVVFRHRRADSSRPFRRAGWGHPVQFPEAITIQGLWSPTVGPALLVVALVLGYVFVSVVAAEEGPCGSRVSRW
jgi:hypothetical protein